MKYIIIITFILIGYQIIMFVSEQYPKDELNVYRNDAQQFDQYPRI